MIRIRFSGKFPQAAFDSWYRAIDKHGPDAVSEMTNDGRNYRFTITP
ncbi:hypothetical protein F5_00002 [Xanthomonas phage F5]|uniref:Uncharacterized protein n=1 Tax=Xanthomonas phage F5 TaxID=3003369 RepID=A0AAE9VLR2_9CAUD|nr:hypothetical protein F5_00002 [Xanthomonas phage F5]